MTRIRPVAPSRYRDENDRIEERLQFKNATGLLQENFLFLEVEAESPRAATDTANSIASRFANHLSLATGNALTPRALYVEDDQGDSRLVPRKGEVIPVVLYDLGPLRSEIRAVQTFAEIENKVLERAFQYYTHGLLLFDRRAEIAEFPSIHFDLIVAAVFLNLWKSISTVIGESGDRDYQSRYQQLGLDYEFFKSRIEAVRDLRDHYDVAHRHLDRERLKEAEKNIAMAIEVAQKVLGALRDRLAAGGGPLT